MTESISDYDFDLPPGLIAQIPGPERDRSKLLVLHRGTAALEHRIFNEVERYLEAGDVLVINDTRVVPVKLIGKKRSGGRVECLILEVPPDDPQGTWTGPCLMKGRRANRPGERIDFGGGLSGEPLPGADDGLARMRFSFPGGFRAQLETSGQTPLPPYIRLREGGSLREQQDRERYQTVYALHPGAVAAPTAGLHFTAELLARIRGRGVLVAPLTLHVGYGTFAPIKTENLERHRMHPETYRLPEETVGIIRRQRERGKRILAVGTTTVRVLEFVAERYGALVPSAGECDLFIRPGFRFQVVDRMITNFHLPRTTLMLLVSAFAGRADILRAYREAIARGYRFYSYGDAMLII